MSRLACGAAGMPRGETKGMGEGILSLGGLGGTATEGVRGRPTDGQSRGVHDMDVRLLASWGERLRGLLGSDDQARPVMLVGCRSIHTFGMAYPIDLVFVDDDGAVIKACLAVPPGRVVSSRRAKHVIERPASSRPWPHVGERVRIRLQFDASNQEGADDGTGA